jgi:DamX protein
MKQQTLLASQEDMLARLVHNLNYGDGVIILSGDEGSGRSTLALSIFEQLDTYNQALVSCPRQCTLSEMRHKVIHQFFTNPTFDAEAPIDETFLHLIKKQMQSMLLVLDDADLLNQAIIDDLLKLSHMQSQGIRMRIMLIVHKTNLPKFRSMIPKKYRTLMLPFDMPMLLEAERQQLYLRLVARTSTKPDFSHESIYRMLARQSGKPAEVVALVQQAIHHPEMLQQQQGSFFWGWFIGILSFIGVFFALWFFVLQDIDLVFLIDDEVRSESMLAKIKSQKKSPVNQAEAKPVEPIEIQSSETFLPSMSAKNSASEAKTAVEPQVDEPKPENLWKLQESQFQMSYELRLPKQGYTIQLAAVQQISSLSHLWLELKKESQVYLLKRQEGYVLLLGAFKSRAEAQAKMSRLRIDADIWIRSWKNLPAQDFQRLILNDAI